MCVVSVVCLCICVYREVCWSDNGDGAVCKETILVCVYFSGNMVGTMGWCFFFAMM